MRTENEVDIENTLEVQRTHSLGRTQGNSTLENSRTQALWDE